MDDLNYLFEPSPGREYSVLETLESSQVPTDMIKFVPDFHPLGSLRRLQGAIELASLYGEDTDDEGYALDEIESVDYGCYTREDRLKAQQIASNKPAQESFSLGSFKVPSDKIIGLDDIKEESNANDTTLEIHNVETDAEKENFPVFHNGGNLVRPYGVTAFKKKERIKNKLAKCEFGGSQICLTSLAAPLSFNRKSRLELKCSRNAARTLNSQITQMRDPFDSVKLKKQGQLILLKP